jgi:hypothetical protein
MAFFRLAATMALAAGMFAGATRVAAAERASGSAADATSIADQWYWSERDAERALENDQPDNFLLTDCALDSFLAARECWTVVRTVYCRGVESAYHRLHAAFRCAVLAADDYYPTDYAFFRLTLRVKGKSSFALSEIKLVRRV